MSEGRPACAAQHLIPGHVSPQSQLETISERDKGKPRKRVAVLGAGMAGLAAARELSGRGHRVTIFEGSQRVGGRVWTKRFAKGAYHELGAMRIPASHDYTRYFIDQVGLTGELRTFFTSYKEPDCFLHLRGSKVRIRDAGRTNFYKRIGYKLTDAQNQLATTQVPPAIFGMMLVNEIAILTDDDKNSLFGLRAHLTPRARHLSRTSLREFLLSGLRGNRDALELIGATTGLEVWWDKSVGMFIRDEITKNGAGLQELKGGMERLPKALAMELQAGYGEGDSQFTVVDEGPHIRLNRRVRTIASLPSSVFLLVDSLKHDTPPVPEAQIGDALGEGEWIQFDHVICTIPFTVLRGLTLEGFSPSKVRAIRNLGYASSTKVLLHCKQRFWESKYNIFGGASFSDRITRATYYPSDNARTDAAFVAPEPAAQPFIPGGSFAPQATEQSRSSSAAFDAGVTEQPGVLVGSYNWGKDAQRMGKKSLEERREACIDVISAFHPEIKEFLADDDNVASIAWDQHPWAQGAFCFYQPGDMEQYYRDAIRSEGNVHFAGEHCSLDQGWIQGALISALRAVEEVVSA
ncbi:MAG TPA: NAD(P)/FAD-dependent oxidoreductase [Pirellulaceae bacterium]|nr:NAD(P)/FAD-dependent oxidoreductase [Pirellulaceae bacterium]